MSWLWPIAYAQTTRGLPVLEKVKTAIVDPIIWLLVAVSVVLFLYGLYEMLANEANEEARRTGQQHVLWGVIGIFIMVSAFGILNLVCRTIGCN